MISTEFMRLANENSARAREKKPAVRRTSPVSLLAGRQGKERYKPINQVNRTVTTETNSTFYLDTLTGNAVERQETVRTAKVTTSKIKRWERID